MKSLKTIMESILDRRFGGKILDELENFIDVLKSLKYETNDRGTYGYGEEELCDAAERVAKAKEFKRIPYADAKKKIVDGSECSILVINWADKGSHEWCIVDAKSGEYFKVNCLLAHEHRHGPWTAIKHGTIQRDHEYEAIGRTSTNPCYILPAGVCEFIRKSMK